MELAGRSVQREALRDLIGSAHAGHGAALVIRAEAGMGKTSLLDDAVASATDFHVARVAGVESEMELPYAGLHRVLLPFLEHIPSLPARQRTALRSAFGRGGLQPADRFAVGLATLSLLDGAAAQSPVLCTVDDVQWIDRESLEALALTARRLGAERIAIIFAGRHYPDIGTSLDGIPDLRLDGLADVDAAELVHRVVHRRLAPAVVERIVADTDGTPMAIIELADELGADELAARTLAPEPLPVGRRIEAHFLRQVEDLPEATRTYLLLAAADPTEDASVVTRASSLLELPLTAAEPAIDRGLFVPDGPPAFRHSLIRSAIYGGADAAARRRVHAALADATDRDMDIDRRAWHRASATSGPDETVAEELEAGAFRARLRGGYSAAGMFLARAADLTPDVNRRSDRILAAAASHLAGGAPSRARALLDAADLRFVDPERRALALRLEGSMYFASGDMPRAVTHLVRAAHALAPFDVEAARAALLHAAAAARYAGTFAPVGGKDIDIAAASRRYPLPPEHECTAPHLLLDAYATLHLDGHIAAMPTLREALKALAEADAETEESLLWLGFGAWVATTVGDDEALLSLASRAVDAARHQRAVVQLANGLLYRAFSRMLVGSIRDAQADFAERGELLTALGVTIDVGPMVLAAWTGQEIEARSEIDKVRSYGSEHELGWMLGCADYASAVLEVGLGNYEAALAGTSRRYDDDAFLVVVGFPNIVEALARCGRRDEALTAQSAFAERAKATGGEMSLGLLARSNALLADDDVAEAHYLEAIDRLERSRGELQLGRAHLVYGEWLRRQKRLTDARHQLRVAHDFFVERGAGAFAERARIELEAAGERVKAATSTATIPLTSQESQIARLAAEGLTNQEIASKMFLSASTVDYHLRKVFRKLGISSRRQLRTVLT